MRPLNDYVNVYTRELKKGFIQKAYKGIMSFMSTLKKSLETKYPQYKTSAIYFGYMDMTYFAITSEELVKHGLKIAIVYLHEQNRFELWLSGINRKVQKDYIKMLKPKNIEIGKLSQVAPGVDSIIEQEIISNPNFNVFDELIVIIVNKTIEFVKSVYSLIQ